MPTLTATQQHEGMLKYAENRTLYAEWYGHMDSHIPSRYHTARKHTLAALARIIAACDTLGFDALANDWRATLARVKRIKYVANNPYSVPDIGAVSPEL